MHAAVPWPRRGGALSLALGCNDVAFAEKRSVVVCDTLPLANTENLYDEEEADEEMHEGKRWEDEEMVAQGGWKGETGSDDGSASACDIWPDVASIFTSCCVGAGAGSATVTNALPRLVALGSRFPRSFVDAIVRCARAVLSLPGSSGPAAAAGGRGAPEVAIELLAMSAGQSPNTSLLPKLTAWLVGTLGGGSRLAPRDRHVRQRGVELLWRLLAENRQLGQQVRATENVLLQLCKDKAPVVRLGAIPGLALVGSTGSTAALVQLAVQDLVPKVRAAAISQLSGDELNHLATTQPWYLDNLSEAILDASVLVRTRLLATLRGVHLPPHRCMTALLLRGLVDTSVSVRTECESSLRTWVHGCRGAGESALDALLAFLNHMNPSADRMREAAAEVAVRHLVSRPEWELASENALEMVLHGHGAVTKEMLLLCRVSLALEVDAGSACQRVCRQRILKLALDALESGRSFELKQLLWMLQWTDVGGDGSKRDMLHIVTAVLLRAPLDGWLHLPLDEKQTWNSSVRGQALPEVRWSNLSVPQLSVTLAWHAFGARPGCGSRAAYDALGQFAEVVMVIINAVRGSSAICTLDDGMVDAPAGFSGNHQRTEGRVAEPLEAIAERFGKNLTQAQQALARVTQLQSMRQQLASKGDFVRAHDVNRELVSVEANYRCAENEKEEIARELGERLLRLLGIIEAVFVQSRVDLSQDFSMSLLLEDVLRPALVLIDRVPVGSGAVSWPALRLLAMRCIALHSSMSPETAGQHWPFFTSVLSRYVPTIVDPQHRSSSATVDSVEMVELCVSFLTDAMLLHGTGLESACIFRDVDNAAASGSVRRLADFLSALAPLLSITSETVRFSVPLRNTLARRICSLLSFVKLHDASFSDGVVIAGLGCGVPASVCWAMTWLLVEAFAHRPFDPSSATVTVKNGQKMGVCSARTGGQRDDADVAAAVTRGLLLRFFGVLPRIGTAHHAAVLAAAVNSFLFLEAWHLGVPGTSSCATGQRASALSLPRLIRFFARQLGLAADASTQDCFLRDRRDVATWWLEGLWRPLALVSLECAAISCGDELELPQALIAAVIGIATPGNDTIAKASMMGFAPASQRPVLAAEVAWTVNRAVELWGWNRPSEGGGSSRVPAGLLELRDCSATVGAAALSGTDWASVYRETETRRLQLRRGVARLGVDFRGAALSESGPTSVVPRKPRDSSAACAAGRAGGQRRRRGRCHDLSLPTNANSAPKTPISQHEGHGLFEGADHLDDSAPSRGACRSSERPAQCTPNPKRPRQESDAASTLQNLCRLQHDRWRALQMEATSLSQRVEGAASRLRIGTATRLSDLAERVCQAAAEVMSIRSDDRIEEAADDNDEEASIRKVEVEVNDAVQLALHELELASADL